MNASLKTMLLGSVLGGALIQLTALACGKVVGRTDAQADTPTTALVWSSYTPVITTDGTTRASQLVRGGAIRYAQIGKTVCLQGMVMLGEQSSGSGGTFIKISVPPGLPGAAGVTQYGLGSVVRTGDSSTLFEHGTAAIETDVNNFILSKQSGRYFLDGDARPGAGILWVAAGCYETHGT